MKKRVLGITMLELLIALALLGTIFTLASSGIVSSLRAQSINQTTVNNQAKLRRVMEVLSQDLRSAVLGGLTGSPFASDSDSISFSLLDGGAGFPVTSLNLSGGTLTVQAQNTATLGVSTGNQVLVVNPGGDGIIIPVTSVAAATTAQRFNLTFGNCANSIPAGDSYLLFKVKTVGLEFNTTTRQLLQREGTSTTSTPVAFGISGFNLTYIYEPYGTTTGTSVERTSAITETSSWPTKVATISGSQYSLVRVKVALASSEGQAGRNYEAYIDLASTSNNVRLGRLLPCN
jgi:type II secretory pathway pseudopilin PulG